MIGWLIGFKPVDFLDHLIFFWGSLPFLLDLFWGVEKKKQTMPSRNIISIVRTSLENLIMAIEGTVVMTVDLLEDSNCVFDA